MNSIEMKPIGYLKSCFKERFGTPRQGSLTPNSKAYLELERDWLKGLEGIEAYSHVWLISWLHRSEPTNRVKIKPPRVEGQRLGVFATRGPHRPNPIGLTLAQIHEVDKSGIWIKGVDLIEGTPILDIKPYVPRYDFLEATYPAWIDEDRTISVEVSKEFLKELEALDLPESLSKNEFIDLIKDSLMQDPRPKVYKARTTAVYYIVLYDFDVRCEYENDCFKIAGISKLAPSPKADNK